MKDYSNAKIYKLIDNDGYFYIGSTCVSLSSRFGKHKDKAKKYPERTIYKRFLSVGWDRVKIILIEANNQITNMDELRQLEDKYIQDFREDQKCLNILRSYFAPGMDSYANKQEWINRTTNQYYHQNKKQISEKTKQYRKENKEKIKERRSKQTTCELCKVTFLHDGLARHKRSKKHQQLLNKFNTTGIECQKELAEASVLK